ncbi:MAG: pilus assembly protein PilM, partial [Candidatus Contubernalis sp.]|nr:pilus assembly protein PilM [Candidatus Contubernalis sp.]
MFKNKKTVLGLEVGNLSLKLVELKRDKKAIVLTNYGIIPLPPEPDEVKKAALIITEIRKMLRSKKIRTREVVFSLKERDVIMRFLRLPLMPEKELKEILKQEVFRLSIPPKEEISWDYLLFPEEEGRTEIGAIIILSERKIVAPLTSLIQQIPLKPLSVTVTALALWETISKLEYKEKETLLSLHIDEEVTTIILLKGRNLSFVRKIYVAADTFFKEVSKKLDLSQEEIEKLQGELKSGILFTSVEEALNLWLGRLAEEILRSLEYHRTELKATEPIKPDRLVVSGPGSQWKGVTDFFAERLGVKTEVFDLFKIIKVDPTLFDMRQLHEAAPLLTIATGLSLSQLAPAMARLKPSWRAKERI